MGQNRMYVLDFQSPALVGKQLTYLRATQFAGQLVALHAANIEDTSNVTTTCLQV